MNHMLSKPAVILLSQVPPPWHGSTVMTLFLQEQLGKCGYGVRLLDRRFSRTADEVGKGSVRKVLQIPSLLVRAWRDSKSKDAIWVVFLTNRKASFLIDSLICRILKRRGVRYCLYLHTAGYERLANSGVLWRALLRNVLGSSCRVVFLAQSLANEVVGLISPEKVRIIPNSLSSPHDLVRARFDERPYMLFYSNFLPEKGVLTFIAVAERLLAIDESLRFVIAGSGSQQELRDLREAIELTSNESKYEIVSEDVASRKWTLLSRAKVLLFPSAYRYEAQPLSIIEALCCSTPTVAFDVGAIGDLLCCEGAGKVVPVGDVGAMADEAYKLASDPSYWAESSSCALECFNRHHSDLEYRARWGELIKVVNEQGFSEGYASRRRIV